MPNIITNHAITYTNFIESLVLLFYVSTSCMSKQVTLS